MNLDSIKEAAQREMPQVKVRIVKDSFRHNVIDPLKGHENIGIELGVAKGIFSERMINSGKFLDFFGVDVYGDIHDTEEYKIALRRVGLTKSYKLLRMTFDDALEMFEDEFFDFIYVDGFAHTGEEGGETLIKWYGKLKIGGIMAGDDYHDNWPLVKWAVNHLVNQLGVSLNLTEKVEEEPYCRYPSWFFTKEQNKQGRDLFASQRLMEIGRSERDRINEIRMSRENEIRMSREKQIIMSRENEIRMSRAKHKIRKVLVNLLKILGLKDIVKTLIRNK